MRTARLLVLHVYVQSELRDRSRAELLAAIFNDVWMFAAVFAIVCVFKS